MNILAKYLKKIGVKSYEELNEEERATYREWEISISGRKLTDEDVKEFLELEEQTAVQRLTEVNLSVEDLAFRKAEVKLIQKIKRFLDSPKIEKAMMEKQLEAQL
jgi:hypothetical protein